MTKYASLVLGFLTLLGCGKSEVNGSESHFVMCTASTDCTQGTCDDTRGLCVDANGEPIAERGALHTASDKTPDDNAASLDNSMNGGAPPETAVTVPDAGPSSVEPSVPPLEWSSDAKGGQAYTLVDGPMIIFREQQAWLSGSGGFDYECQTALPACGPDSLCLDDVKAHLAHPDVQAAFSNDEAMFGCNNSKFMGDNPTLVSLGETAVHIGWQCEQNPVPDALHALKDLLFALAAQQEALCAYAGPSDLAWGYTTAGEPLRNASNASTVTAGVDFGWKQVVFAEREETLTCSNRLADCESGYCARDVAAAFSNPVVAAAVATGGFYGLSPDSQTGGIFRIENGAREPLVINMATRENCEVPCDIPEKFRVPDELFALAFLLDGITQQQLALPGCEVGAPYIRP